MSVAQKDGIDQRSYAYQITYEDLYRRWEEGNWKATDIDFTADREGWGSLSDIQRRSAMWIFSMFFYGEDPVTDNLSPYIDAAPTEEQKYFLATQQVDEARHAVFFHRFFKEVIGAGDTIGSTLASTVPELGWGYRGVFDRLDRMATSFAATARCRSSPRPSRSTTWSWRPRLRSPASTSSRTTLRRRRPCPASRRACTTSRATSSATSASASRSSPSSSARVRRVQGRGGRDPPRGAPLLARRLRAAGWDLRYTRD